LQSEYDPNHFCISQKSFAIGIAIAGLILMAAVVVAILILVSKRRRKNLSTTGELIFNPTIKSIFCVLLPIILRYWSPNTSHHIWGVGIFFMHF
jgi:hypothetical protein